MADTVEQVQERVSDSRWPDRLRLPLEFDSQRLAADLSGLGAIEWTGHFVPQHYEGEWSVLPLRGHESFRRLWSVEEQWSRGKPSLSVME